MKLFVDTADVAEIEELAAAGGVDGVTTNPSLAAKTGRPFLDDLKAICALVAGPISAEVTATEAKGMVAEGLKLRTVADNVVVKVPLTWEGLKACKALSSDGHPVNVTLCFSPVQAMLAAKAGATFVSPFIGRLDDAGHDGMDLIREIRVLFDNYDELETEILAASIRSVTHVRDAALIGADAATLPPKIFKQLVKHPLTDSGLEAFLKDWAKTGQKIV